METWNSGYGVLILGSPIKMVGDYHALQLGKWDLT